METIFAFIVNGPENYHIFIVEHASMRAIQGKINLLTVRLWSGFQTLMWDQT